MLFTKRSRRGFKKAATLFIAMATFCMGASGGMTATAYGEDSPMINRVFAAGFNTNLENLKYINGNWQQGTAGVTAQGTGDCFAMSDSAPNDFIFEAEVSIKAGDAASIVFRSNSTGSAAYVANVDLGQRNARIFKFNGSGNGASTLGTYSLPNPALTDYKLRVEVVGNQMQYYLNDLLIIACEDSQYPTGKLGLLICNSTVTFQNAVYQPLAGELARLSGLTVGGVTLDTAFSADKYIYSGAVPYATESISVTAASAANIKISAQKKSGELTLAQTDASGAVSVPLAEGDNIIYLQTEKNGVKGMTTVLNIKRATNPDNYYTEKYRPQYHVTPESGWLNDPNGMVYYEGEYHLFYQYFPDSKFPADQKYWAHVASTDMVHWEKRPVALSPDQYGSIWSGSAVLDHNNTSGLFTDTENGTGLVAFYTSFNPAQRQCMAYSKDGGNTWIKYNGGAPIITNAADPLSNNDFRDPKVFWHEESNQWMMAVAGGPLRFYSSKNLIDWKKEGMQNEIHTECPDFFKLPIDGDENNQKWVLSGGGSWYMIGEFSLVGGVWKFVPDSNERYRFNYAPDVYAAQSFSDTPDGRRIKVDWMVNIGYPFQTGNITDPWNGAMTLPYEMELKTVNGKAVLTQNPVSELDSLHTREHKIENKAVNENTVNPLKDLLLDKYEIKATIDIGTATEFGFRLRVGNNQYTTVRYNTNTKLLSLDRSKSGASPVDSFPGTYSARVEPVGGKIELQMFADWSSLELFAGAGAYPFTALIYPEPTSTGLEFYATGGTATIDSMRIFEQESIYRDEKAAETANSIKVISGSAVYETGDQFTVWATPAPGNATGAEVNWTVSDSSVLRIVEQGDKSLVLKALKNGTCKVTAKTKTGNLTDSLDITVKNGLFITNLEDWSALGGSWNITENGYEGVSAGNGPVFTQTTAGNFTYEADVTYTAGKIGSALIFRAKDDLSVWYSADINEDVSSARILKFTRNPVTGSTSDITLGDSFNFAKTADHKYSLKVIASGSNIKFYVNGQLAVDTNDSSSLSGRFGLNVCDITGVFQNVFYTPEGSESTLNRIELSTGELTPDSPGNTASYTSTVPNSTDSVSLKALFAGYKSVTLNGKAVNSNYFSEPVTLAVGVNTLTLTLTEKDNTVKTVAIVITREASEKAYKNGDVNGDDEVDTLDMLTVRNVILKTVTDPAIVARAYVNSDQELDITDILAVRNIIMNN